MEGRPILALGGAVADHPGGGPGQEQAQDKQPAALDELEVPEAAGGLVSEVLEVALLGEPLLDGLGGREPACLPELGAQAVDLRLAGRYPARGGPPLAEQPGN